MIVFEKPGRENLEQTVDLAIQAAQDRGIGTIVAPSSKGDTARYLVKALDAGLNVVAVTLCNGFKAPGEQAFPADLRAELTEKGMHILTASHVLSGAERGLSTRFQGVYPVEVMAHTLRMFGQGTKVAVECAVMALDAGLIPYMEPILALGGTGGGVDTALIMRTAHAARILDCRIAEIICKPS